MDIYKKVLDWNKIQKIVQEKLNNEYDIYYLRRVYNNGVQNKKVWNVLFEIGAYDEV